MVRLVCYHLLVWLKVRSMGYTVKIKLTNHGVLIKKKTSRNFNLYLIDGTLTGTKDLGQSEAGVHGNEAVLDNPQMQFVFPMTLLFLLKRWSLLSSAEYHYHVILPNRQHILNLTDRSIQWLLYQNQIRQKLNSNKWQL